MTDFSVKKAVLYRSGIGWFSAEGEVEGDVMYFPVASSSLDDFLKTSLVGIKGGTTTIKNLSFETKGLSKKLFSSSHVYLGVIDFLRGSSVDILFIKDEKEVSISGKVLGYQEIEGKEKKYKVSLLSGAKVVLIDGLAIQEITPKDEKDVAQLREFLATLANESDNEKQTLLKIQLNEEGDYTVKVQFVQDIPAWKLAYRMIIGDDDNIQVDSYGIVDNATLVDWIDANLVLSTKTPVSFLYDLATPHIIERPRISRKTDIGIAVPELEPMPAPPPGSPAMRMKTRASAPMMQEIMDYDYGGEEEAYDEFETKFEEQASLELGESIEFILKQPVTIRRKQSSVVPLASGQIKGGKKHYFNKNNHNKHPFFVLDLINELPYALENGPVSVYQKEKEGNNFKGEAMIPRIGKEEEFLLSYALDKNVAVTEREDYHAYFEKIEISGLLRKEIYTNIRVYEFEITNKSDDLISLYLAVPKSDYNPFEGKIHGHQQEHEFVTVSDEYRVKYNIESKSTDKVKFKLARRTYQSDYLYYLSDKDLEKLLKDSNLSEKDKEIIRAIYNISIELKELRSHKELLNQRYSRSKDRRQQIISTLEVLDKNSEDATRKKYIVEIETIDETINSLLEEIEQLDTKINELDSKQRDYKQLDQLIKQTKGGEKKTTKRKAPSKK
ncbi:MAG: hypothetical protein INQ03_00010 [Candidatus Heimdallarchaeota archaeon]|nr:hypothetical protein [Candidatus Heimdallarchaeota archaeon]